MKFSTARAGGLLAALAVLGSHAAAQIQHIHVDPKAPGSQSGISWFDAYHTIQEAIDDANLGATGSEVHILVAEGTYQSTQPTGGQWNASFSSFNSRDDTILLKDALGMPLQIHGGYLGCDDGRGLQDLVWVI